MEHLLVAEGWLENPCEKKTRFENLDQTSIFDENLTQFWALCGQNRDSGVSSILENEAVKFKHVEHVKVKWKKLQKA